MGEFKNQNETGEKREQDNQDDKAAFGQFDKNQQEQGEFDQEKSEKDEFADEKSDKPA